ncbi:hypothetical protein BJ973_008049 [Actinoplanes tereljensis]|uniref:Uncharacterized protein n=1 Tax=Paractinoplanes tereljensis TaxID=571912 RepID=A0A919NUM9_9ACTN|nr:hypothetical protein [Actinoplanes tereljensis]GIF24570.1 hypothetical protein Ate02nite_73000 [Actinoplanes tereljensis]
MGKNTKRSAVVAGVAAVLIGGGAAAWAFTGWNVDGSGTAEADAAQIKPLTATASLGANLYPGRKTKITLKVDNPNEFPVTLTGALTPGSFEVSKGGTVEANKKCSDELKTTGINVVEPVVFPGKPAVPAEKSTTVDTDITIKDLPQSCAGLHVKANFTFTAAQTAV